MNWIERMYEIKGRDLYSQNGEGFLLEYVWHNVNFNATGEFIDIGGGDGFYLSNIKHLENLGWQGNIIDKENGDFATNANLASLIKCRPDLISIDTDGNDYWFIERSLEILKNRDCQPSIIIAEFNPAFTDSRAIKYNPDHVWAGDDYYGFSFEAGMKLAEKHGYKVIFNVANMNLIMVRKDLIEGLTVPPVTYEVNKFFKESGRTDWVTI